MPLQKKHKRYMGTWLHGFCNVFDLHTKTARVHDRGPCARAVRLFLARVALEGQSARGRVNVGEGGGGSVGASQRWTLCHLLQLHGRVSISVFFPKHDDQRETSVVRYSRKRHKVSRRVE